MKERNEKQLLQHQNKYIKEEMIRIKERMEKYFVELQSKDVLINKKQI